MSSDGVVCGAFVGEHLNPNTRLAPGPFFTLHQRPQVAPPGCGLGGFLVEKVGLGVPLRRCPQPELPGGNFTAFLLGR